jgi:ABC-type transporter MlaC component
MRNAFIPFAMKHLLAISTLFGASLSYLPAAEPTTAQDQQIIAVVKEIQAQQAQIADSQAKIEAKMAAVAEAVRMAKIYASRAGH